jgi:hypothetical protein
LLFNWGFEADPGIGLATAPEARSSKIVEYIVGSVVRW